MLVIFVLMLIAGAALAAYGLFFPQEKTPKSETKKEELTPFKELKLDAQEPKVDIQQTPLKPETKDAESGSDFNQKPQA